MPKNSYFTMAFFTRKLRAEGIHDHKVYVRISVAGQHTDLFIGRSVNPDNWDSRQKKSIGRSRRDLELNKYLDDVRSRFNEIHNSLIRDNKLINPNVMRGNRIPIIDLFEAVFGWEALAGVGFTSSRRECQQGQRQGQRGAFFAIFRSSFLFFLIYFS